MLHSSAKEHRVLLGDFELVFSWKGDRWSHRIRLPDGDGTVAWRSVEGSAEPSGDAAWPASPVIVELSTVPSAAAIVGVGRAGRSHYSVSFSASKAACLAVECACRIQEPPGWIGSTYERLGNIQGDIPNVGIHNVKIHNVGECGQPESLVRIAAAIDSALATSLPRTVTWSYVFGPTGPVPCHRPG